MKRHTHKWNRTGVCCYTCPLQYEYKCQCGKVKWVEEETIPTRTLTETDLNEMKKRYPQYFKKTI